MNVGHIIAIGGGGYGRYPKHNKIENNLTERIKINYCFSLIFFPYPFCETLVEVLLQLAH